MWISMRGSRSSPKRARRNTPISAWTICRANESIQAVEGRTIHADGTVIPFTGQPYDKELASAGGYTKMEKVFTLPDAQVGSILEFHYLIIHGADESPVWYVQQSLFVKKASFHFVPTSIYPVQTTWSLPAGKTVTGKFGEGIRPATGRSSGAAG